MTILELYLLHDMEYKLLKIRGQQYSHSHKLPRVRSVSPYEDSFSNIPVIPLVLQVSDVYVESKLVYTSGTSLGTSQTLAASHNAAYITARG